MGCLDFLFPPRLASAELVVLQPGGEQSGRRIAFKFVLRSYKLSKQNNYVSPPIAGLPGSPIQFVSGQPRLLSLAMDFDARSESRDVRELTNDIAALMKIDRDTHVPPLLRFEWKGVSLRCVLEGAREEITSLFWDGRPSRARMHATFKEFRTLAELQAEANLE
jgi:hypothetical protein